MAERFAALVLRLFKVPPRPDPPPGDRSHLRVFRAGRNFYRYHLAQWVLAQLGALFGLLIGVLVLREMDFVDQNPLLYWGTRALEAFAWVGFLAQIPITFAALRLDYEQRWYMVSSHALRIREGITTVREQTLTFANVQNIGVRQGPLQRLLGIADVEVRTAGGGGSGGAGPSNTHAHDAHTGYLRGVDNAEMVRDVIRERLRQYRDAGLGDPEEPAPLPPGDQNRVAADDLLHAARAMLHEARALNLAVTQRKVPPARE